MTRDDHRQTVAHYQAGKGKATPAEYMAYMWARQALGERLSAGQRGFLEAAQKPAWHNETAAPAPPPIHPKLDDVPAWATEDEQ